MEEEQLKLDETTFRVTEKPEPKTVTFVALQSFGWHGQEFEKGVEYTWNEEDFGELMLDVSARTDRLRLVQEIGTELD